MKKLIDKKKKKMLNHIDCPTARGYFQQASGVMASPDAKTRNMEGRFAPLEVAVSQFSLKLERNTNSIEYMRLSTNKRFEVGWEKLDNVHGRIEEMERRINGQLERINGRLEEMDIRTYERMQRLGKAHGIRF